MMGKISKRVLSLQWFMLTIVHTYSRFRSSDVKCYVNGELVSGGDLTMAQMNEVRFKVFCSWMHVI